MSDVESAIDAVYAADLDEFVATRDRIARELKQAGDAEGAKRVLAIRKPGRAAWAVNRAVRRDPQAFDAVTEAGRRLVAAQQESLDRGTAGGLHDALRARTAAVHVVADLAVSALGRTGESARDAIEQTLLAASIDESASEEARAGRLSRDLTPPDIFETLQPGAFEPRARELPAKAALPAKPGRSRPARRASEPAQRSGPAERVVETQAALDQARQAAAAAAAERDEARAEAEEAARRERDATRAADIARRALREAEARARTADRHVAEAERAVRDATR
jgi:hypothetical protein